MNDVVIGEIASKLQIKSMQVTIVLKMLESGNTIPFIARYRKNETGGLNEEIIHEINKEYEYEVNLQNRKEVVINLINEKGLLTAKLKANILAATKLVTVEDLYLPFKEKRNTLATIAKKAGLEPLAKYILKRHLDIEVYAKQFINNEVTSVSQAITMAKHIISEDISENIKLRQYVRNYLVEHASMISKVKKQADDKNKVFENYYDYSEQIKTIKNHRILAINRGEKLKILNVKLNFDKQAIYDNYFKFYKLSDTKTDEYIKEAIIDGLNRLVFTSIEREIRSDLTKQAETQAITLFATNLEQLLMQQPLKNKKILGLDPAYKSGCKLAVINEFGDLKYINKIFLTKKYEQLVLQIINEYKIDIIAIGNGTASRESEEYIAKLIAKHNLNCKYAIVNEAGASVYSASKQARAEFPNLEVEQRSAVSIARRLQDPLAELVKIDPKSIGVGQYQHDVNQGLLSKELDFTVEKVVNQVGVDINSASEAILIYIAGVNKKIAKSIVDYRSQNGLFNNRDILAKVKYFGEKSFEQAIGFLRINDGDNILDQTSIHPESYQLVLTMLASYNLKVNDMGKPEFNEAIAKLDVNTLVKTYHSDQYTINDIIAALLKPKRDPRFEIDPPILKSNILSISDLTIGLELQGTVRNIVDFGVFVDIGIKNDGLVHISKLCNGFVKHPLDVVSVGDIVTVTVIGIDEKTGKVSLSMI